MFPVDAEPTGAVGTVVDRDRRTEELTAEIRDVASQISRLQARQAELVGGLEEVYVGEITLSHWIGWQVGLMPAETRRTLGLARRLSRLPLLRGAFAEGRLSEGTISTLVSVATPDNEAELLDTSQLTTGAQLARLARTMRKAARPPAEDEVADHEVHDEQLSFGHDDDGWWWCRGSLRPEWGAQVEAALRAAQDLDREPGEAPVPYAEALVRVAGGFLGSIAGAGADIVDRYQVIVRVDTNATGALDGHIHGAGHLEAHTIEELLCESYLSVVLTDNGRPVSVASPGRFASADQRRALVVRDCGCRFPGCGRTRFLKAHHLVRHTDGGPTSLANMILLCQAHHSLIHRPGWTITGDPDGHLGFVDPRGRDHARAPERPPPRGDPPPPGPRNTGTGERLSAWGADVILHNWMREPAWQGPAQTSTGTGSPRRRVRSRSPIAPVSPRASAARPCVQM